MSQKPNAPTLLEERRATWDRYTETWKVEGLDAKKALFTECLAPDCTYTDPLQVAEGFDALADYMVDFHRQIPGGHFVTTSFETHHDHSLAKWEMLSGEGEVVGVGASHGRYDQHGKLKAMTGFFAVPEM